MTNAILIIIGFLILVYYTKSELKILIEEKAEPVKAPEPLQVPEPPRQVQTIREPEPLPQVQIIGNQEPPKMGRRQLEQAARNVLTACGCQFDVYDFTRYKSDIELMEIITEYSLNYK